MCLLALRLRTVPGVPLVLAANRDEDLDRAFDPPRLHPGPVPFLAPVDRRAGGTWLGINGAGIVVAVTNRPQRGVAATRRSRGLLAGEALGAASLDRLRGSLEAHLRGQRTVYGNFHLLASDGTWAFVARYHDGWTEFTDLDGGDHFLTNEDDLDEPRVEEIAAGAGGDAAAEADRLQRILGLHDPVLPGGRAPCKHDGGRGTVSAAVLAVPDAGMAGAVVRFAAGPPCTAPFADLSAAARGLAP